MTDGPPEVSIVGANEDLYEVTLALCEQCLNGEGGECHHPGCALWLNRAPDISLKGNPMVCYRPAPTTEKAWLITPCEDCGAPTHEGHHLLQEGTTDVT